MNVQRRESLPADPLEERKDTVDIHLAKVSGAMSILKGTWKQSPHRLVPWSLKGLGSQWLCLGGTHSQGDS